MLLVTMMGPVLGSMAESTMSVASLLDFPSVCKMLLDMLGERSLPLLIRYEATTGIFIVLDAENIQRYEDLKPGDYVELTVSDNGCGIDPKIIDRIFDPFFTTKPIGKGSGMGLAVSHGIVKSHGGAITVTSRPGEGTTFTVLLPKSQENAEEQQGAAAAPLGSETILLVDDEECMAFPLKRMLERLGYTVTAMTGSLETLELFKKDPRRYDLLITDLTMPHLTGDRLAAEVTAVRPDMPVILATGYADAVDDEKVRKCGIKAFIPKPCTKEDLARTIRLVLDGRV